MALQRHRSVPVELLPLSLEQGQYDGPLLPSYSTTPNPYLSPPDPGKSKFLALSDALAGMTFELDLRHVNARARCLERDVQRLVTITADDQDFRRNNEAKLTRLMQEIEAVKAHMARYEGPLVTQADIDRLKQEMAEAWRTEMDDLKVQMDLLAEQMRQTRRPIRAKEVEGNNQTTRASTTQPLPTQPALQPTLRMETRAKRRERLEFRHNRQQGKCFQSTKAPPQVPNSDPELSAPSNYEHRIAEAINSTKRWNREHKVTKCSDPEFIVNYLTKQGQRDPGIAKVFQRAILKRAFQGTKMKTGEPWHPRDLKELCQNVTWRDVIDVATEVLVTKKHRTVQLLGRPI
ncbi:hypothetical protein N0V84_011855 [Fusarium piperis]|uniref:Uncharacterized protein n=1 Tax=Fusarium piperis TaxID=1435070 RepID=A0A9W8TDP5_9HYPO|nr:hypothetical protein N0V84_011855 [Fusarium piperis]